MAKIISCKPAGHHQTYDLEVNHPDHQFYLANGALTSNSHAMAYAITSYQCAWFLTYYPVEWITTYIDYCTIDKGKVSGKEDPKVIAMSEARKLGYTIAKPDINNSEFEFTIDQNNSSIIIPGFASLKHVGKSALVEIKRYRPYTKVQDLLIETNNTWRHSKFNKRSLSTLIKLEALDSMDLVGDKPHHLFRNYKEMHDILVDKYDKLKAVSNRKKKNDVLAQLNAFIEEHRAENPEVSEWTNADKIKFGSELAGNVDIDLLISPEAKQHLTKMKLDSIDNFPFPDPDEVFEEGDPPISKAHWAIVRRASVVVSSSGKKYLLLKVFAEFGEEHRVNVWAWGDKPIDQFTPNTVIAAEFIYDAKYGSFVAPKFKLHIVGDPAPAPTPKELAKSKKK